MPPSRRRWKRSNGAAVRRALRFSMVCRRKWVFIPVAPRLPEAATQQRDREGGEDESDVVLRAKLPSTALLRAKL